MQVAVQKTDSKKTKYHLEEVPTAPWTNIGGLDGVIDTIRAEIEEPFKYKDTFQRYGRKPAKGILLFGPPGCGKTMVARSIAYSLSQMAGKEGKNGHFINVKGPEILEKWVGNSEGNIRRIYSAARETAEETKSPVVVFIDEAEAVLKRRGSGISTDVYDSIVPQFLAELDGINGNGNVITVLATNREDILDPAVVRDGRVDRRIKVPRPNQEGAEAIFNLYLQGKPIAGLPLIRKSSEKLAKEITQEIYDDKNIAYLVVDPRKGTIGQFNYSHLLSGAMIKGIVDRACGYAIRREIDTKKNSGIGKEDLQRAVREEFADTIDFTQALVADDWQSVFASKGRYLMDMHEHGYLVLEKANETQLNATGGKK
jgi:proteasome-associated ATPase